MKNSFIRCGMYGWCMEVLWTGLHSLLRNDPKLTGFSSLRMFPIYGMASLFAPLSHILKRFSTFTRGFIYMLGIFAVEYTSGTYLKRRGKCPWDYSDSPYQINGVIRLDYAPIWFLTGLFFERAAGKKT
ncbi:MAG: putative ABC transporter permease [Clostridiales bacterium]|nr:putative ABC transporter permease [Clostridiales bacterium]